MLLPWISLLNYVGLSKRQYIYTYISTHAKRKAFAFQEDDTEQVIPLPTSLLIVMHPPNPR